MIHEIDSQGALAFLPGSLFLNPDPGLIEQSALKLAVSARDATPEGGTLTIETARFELPEVEYEPDVRATSRSLLEPSGYRVVAASHALRRVLRCTVHSTVTWIRRLLPISRGTTP